MHGLLSGVPDGGLKTQSTSSYYASQIYKNVTGITEFASGKA